MPSAFEFFGVKATPASTPISTLVVNNRLSQLQTESKEYFSIPENAAAADNNVLAVEISHTFSLSDGKQTGYLNQCTACFNDKSAALVNIDMKIMTGIAVVIAASTLSFLPLAGYAFWLGLGAAAYYLQQRSQAYAEYEQSLTLLVANCNWSLGKDGDTAALVNNPAIRDMMTALYPVLTETQVRHLIHDDIEEGFAAELRAYEEKFTSPFGDQGVDDLHLSADERIALSKKGAEFKRCIYGFNKGNPTDFLDAFLSFVPDLYNAATNGIQKLNHWWNEGSENTAAPSLSATY